MAGSSQTAKTMPPSTPVYAKVIAASAATFSPTCFIETIDLTPVIEAPAATSVATISFTLHSA